MSMCSRCGVEDTMMTACRQCNKVVFLFLSPIREVKPSSSEILRCGTARQPVREQMCGNTALFAELILLSEGIHQTTIILKPGLGSLKYLSWDRYTEERTAFASKLREPVDGCGNCGYWRDTLEACARCCQVF